jgi:hypothetical protein
MRVPVGWAASSIRLLAYCSTGWWHAWIEVTAPAAGNSGYRPVLNVGCASLRNMNVHTKFRNWNRMHLQPLPRFARLPVLITRCAADSQQMAPPLRQSA